MARAGFRDLKALAALIMIAGGAFPQAISLPSGSEGPQAASRDELDAFGLIFEARNGSAAGAAEDFLRRYPGSAFLEYAALAAMHSYYDAGNLRRSGEMARIGLKANPESADALLHSARLLIAPGIEDPRTRAEARRLADAGLARLNAMKLPVSADSRIWLRTRNSFTAVGKNVLGWLLFREGKLEAAMACLRDAAALDPQGEYFYRLALVEAAKGDYSGSGDWDCARDKGRAGVDRRFGPRYRAGNPEKIS